MAESNPPTFSLPRFLARVVPLVIVAGIIWKATATHNASLTVWLTKALHHLARRPAPYMFCDHTTLYWHATMFPPVVALTLGSYWIRWPGRIIRAVAGYFVHCACTAIAITLNESPYLQQTPLLSPLTSTMVNANYLVIGVAIWVLAAGPWYQPAACLDSTGKQQTRWGRAVSAVRNAWFTRVLLFWLALTAVVPMYAMFGARDGTAARARVAESLAAVPFFPHPSSAPRSVSLEAQLERDRAAVVALRAIRQAIESDQAEGYPSAALWHLTAHLLNSLRPEEDPELASQFKAQAALALHQAGKLRQR